VKGRKTVVILVAVAAMLVPPVVPPLFPAAGRGARPIPTPSTSGDREPVDRSESAALFVGVSKFTHRQLLPVPYAVDDAVDLAYLFAFDRRVSLVRCNRVALALSGYPTKEESRRKLELLRKGGAHIGHADAGDISELLRRQAGSVGTNGILILSLATHGYLQNGIPYVLGASSLVERPASTLSVATLLEVMSLSKARRSLVLVDACRERIAPARRSIRRETDTAAPLLWRMRHAHGQAIFYAAAAGQFAYDDDASHNGVFTKAVVDGLSCGASAPTGIVTADTLGTYVENSVMRWIQKNRDPSIRSAIQVSADGEARRMPLSLCWRTCSDPSVCGVARVAHHGSTVEAFASDGRRVWRYPAGARVEQTEVVDLDADATNDVVIGTRQGVSVLDSDGHPLWSAHDGTLRALAVYDLFRKHTRQLATLWRAEGSATSRLMLFSAEGRRLASFDFAGRLDQVAIGRATSHHAPRIVVAGKDAHGAPTVFLLDPKKVERGKPLWSGHLTPRRETISAIEVADYDKNGNRDICITTAGGDLLVLDFKGKVAARHAKRGSGASLQFHLLHSRRTRP
jgi:caspase domain-containing protein